MSAIRPFIGIRYAAPGGDVATKISPPYDVLNEADKQALLDRDPINFVKVDLPHMPPKSAGPPEKYEEARATIENWLADGTLVKDGQPAIYVYHQQYSHAGRHYTRKMFFARLRLEPFGEGSIYPHEQTFGGPKEDRLALTKATEANLSPIFGLYEDADNAVARRLEQALAADPVAVGTMDGVENRLWAVTDTTTIGEVEQMMQPKSTYIADGHHRCGTAMLYRDWLVEQKGSLPEDHPANFVLCVFCAMEDPGLLILPTHRVLPGIEIKPDYFANDAHIDVRAVEASDPSEVVSSLAQYGPQAFAVYDGTKRAYFALRPVAADVLDALEPDHTEAWRRLGLAFLHAYVLDRVVAPKCCGGMAPEVRYIKSDDDAVRVANETNGTAFLMQPTTMEELRGVCSGGDLMPQKSTYFYPKLASGLVINPLSD